MQFMSLEQDGCTQCQQVICNTPGMGEYFDFDFCDIIYYSAKHLTLIVKHTELGRLIIRCIL